MGTKADFRDDVLLGVKSSINLLQYMYQERAQLYGALLILMEKTGTKEFPASLEDFDAVSERHYINFTPNEDKTSITIEMKDFDNVSTEGE